MNQPMTNLATQSIRSCGTPLHTMVTELRFDGGECEMGVYAELTTRAEADKLVARILANREFLADRPAQTV